MRISLYGILLAGMVLSFICGCSGSSPVTPGNPTGVDSHAAAVKAALDGVELQNTELLSVKLDGNELLPWGFKDLDLPSEGTYALEIFSADPDAEIALRVTGASLMVGGGSADDFRGPASGPLAITDLEERVGIHLELIGEHPQVRDITVRTVPSPDLPIPAVPGTVQYTDPESGLTFEIAERELLVGFASGTPEKVEETLIGALGCEILRRIPHIDAYRVRIPSGESYERFTRLFETSGVVRYAEPNSILKPALVPNDTYEGEEYENGLVHLHEAWDITQGTADTIIGLVDTGAMRDHPDIYENVIPGEDFIDPPGDGLGGETPGDGQDNNGDGVPDQNVGHGTHCSGIIGAVGNNSEGVTGHSWHTRILPCRVFPTNGDDGAMDSAIAEAIMYAADQGADGISMSIGGPYGSSTEQNAITYAWNAGSVIVAAAGNSNSSSPFYPASFTHVIGVAATDSSDKKASFSNYGSYVDCCAPGVNIISSIFYTHSGDPWSVPENQRYEYMSGTSMACPQVSGLVALVASYFPTYTTSEVADQVVFTADNIDAINPNYAGKLGVGRINDYRALTTPLAPEFEILKLWSDDDNPLYSQGNRDGFLNPGETIEFRPTVRNIGTKAAQSCVLSLQGGDGEIEFLNESVSLGLVDRGWTVTPDDPLIFRISPQIDQDTDVNLTLHFEYLNGDPIDIPYVLSIRADLGVVDMVTCSGQGLLEDEIRKGIMDVPALAFTLEGDTNYATLDTLTVHQTGTAKASSFTDVELWLDANDDGLFDKSIDTRIAYRSYDHPGYRGIFDDLNDPENGFAAGIDYEEFPPVYFGDTGLAAFQECVVPTAPGVPRTVFVVIGILPTATTGDTVRIGILSVSDVVVREPDQVSPLNFPIQTDEVPIVGTWLDPEQVTHSGPSTDALYSWRVETAICPVTGNVYFAFDSNRNDSFDVFLQRSTDQGETFSDAVMIDGASANEFYPDVQVDSSGTIHVVYYSTKISTNNREIFYARSTDFGLTFEAPVRLTDAVRDSRTPKLAIGPGDSLNVAWHDDRAAMDDYDVYFMRSTDGGATWGNTVQVCDTNPASEEVAIAVGGDGVIHVTWDESSNWYSANVFYSRSTDDGQTWSAPFKITSDTYNNHGWHSDVAADNSGRVYAVFHYVPTTGAAEVSGRVSSDSGANWNTPFNLTNNSIPDSRPGIYCRPDGSYVDIVFRRLEAEAWNIEHIYSKDGLGTWSDPVQISNSVGGDAREAAVVRGANLNIFAFWEDAVNLQGGYEIFYNRFLY